MNQVRPISYVNNFSQLIKEVDENGRIYLEKDGKEVCAELSIREIEELDKIKAIYLLGKDLRRAEERAEKEGWIDEDTLYQLIK